MEKFLDALEEVDLPGKDDLFARLDEVEADSKLIKKVFVKYLYKHQSTEILITSPIKKDMLSQLQDLTLALKLILNAEDVMDFCYKVPLSSYFLMLLAQN